MSSSITARQAARELERRLDWVVSHMKDVNERAKSAAIMEAKALSYALQLVNERVLLNAVKHETPEHKREQPPRL